MKIKAIMFMCNDFDRAVFTLGHFQKHNPDIPIRVINSGGEDPSPYFNTNGIIAEVVHHENLWHKKTACGVGSFGPKYCDVLFEYALSDDVYDHVLLLETDVLTNRPITIEPKFDISGPINFCGGGEHVLYEYLCIPKPYIHTGCGATMFKRSYFEEIISRNYFYMFEDLFEKFPRNYFMDLISTLVARKAGLTFGHWEEVSNIPVHYVDGRMREADYRATLVHNYKI